MKPAILLPRAPESPEPWWQTALAALGFVAALAAGIAMLVLGPPESSQTDVAADRASAAEARR